jgi:beta-1,3-galactosyltransferase 1
MDRVRLLSVQLPPTNNINGNIGNTKGKIKFVRRLALGFTVLTGLGLLYVPAYHSAQGILSGLDETSSSVGSVEGTALIASIGTHFLVLCDVCILTIVIANNIHQI